MPLCTKAAWNAEVTWSWSSMSVPAMSKTTSSTCIESGVLCRHVFAGGGAGENILQVVLGGACESRQLRIGQQRHRLLRLRDSRVRVPLDQQHRRFHHQ